MNVMSQMFDPATGDVVRAEELGIDAGEVALGIIHIMAISYGRVEIVLIEDADGIIGIGHSAAWPGQDSDPAYARTRAREKGKKRLLLSRENQGTFQHRRKLAAAGWLETTSEPGECCAAGDREVSA